MDNDPPWEDGLVKIQEGPAMGAALIGSGLAFLIYQKNQNLLFAGSIGLAVGLADYIILIWLQKFKRKK